MHCCTFDGSSADATATEKIRRATLEKIQRDKLVDMLKTLDALHDLPEIDINDLEKLSIIRGPMLDVDNWASLLPNEFHTRFFMPFDWPQDWLEYEAWSTCDFWMRMDHLDLHQTCNLHFQKCRAKWLSARLSQLNNVDPEIWDIYTGYCDLLERAGLRLPCRSFHRRKMFPYHEYSGHWGYLAKLDTDRPHAACLMLDSGENITSDVLLRSEVAASICMSQYQLKHGFFINHHTKPILITTLFRDQKARFTQAHFDSKQNKLMLRQSRLLDLSGARPGADAWLTIRWMACTPVGETRYPRALDNAEGNSHARASLPPSIMVVSS